MQLPFVCKFQSTKLVILSTYTSRICNIVISADALKFVLKFVFVIEVPVGTPECIISIDRNTSLTQLYVPTGFSIQKYLGACVSMEISIHRFLHT